MIQEVIGYIGLMALSLGWVPQSVETIRIGRSRVNISFLILAATGSGALLVYAYLRHETLFVIVNSLTTTGAFLNIYYKFFPRVEQ